MTDQQTTTSSFFLSIVSAKIRWSLGLVVWLPILFCLGPGTSTFSASPQILQGRQGEVLLVKVPVAGQPKEVRGTFLKKRVLFYPANEEAFEGLLGVDLQAKPGVHDLMVDVIYVDKKTRQVIKVKVIKEKYPVQRLTLPDKMVDLDKKTLARVRKEAKQVNRAFSSLDPRRLWKGTFVEPVQGKVSGRFGSRRVINGQPKRPHSGEDIAAPEGTPVSAMNEGIVRLSLDHFFTGKGVILDHGLGLFSMYFHLSVVDVEEGQMVKKGQHIGKVGSSGRATGPHLHWGVRLNGSRVNPYSLMQVTQTAVASSTS